MNQYAAGIVIYNPDLIRLKENIDAVSPQVKTVYCFDNGSKGQSALKDMLKHYDNVVLMAEKNNLGIATALNRIIDRAHKDQMEWLLTLDQDSVVCNRMIEKLAALTGEEKTLIICPVIEDVRRKNEKPVVTSNTFESVDFCITSGSFMNVEKTIVIGGFDEFLFIGLVDNDICMRANYEGYRIIRNNAVVLNHELGNLTPTKFEKFYLKLGDVLHNETIKKLSYKREVNSLRLYYATRNMFYLKKKYAQFDNENVWYKMIVINSFSSIIRGGYRLNIIKAVLLGIRDGRAVCAEPYVLMHTKIK